MGNIKIKKRSGDTVYLGLNSSGIKLTGDSGSGGGGDLKIAKLTLTGPDNTPWPLGLPVITSDITLGDKTYNNMINPQPILISGNVYDIPCTSGGVLLDIPPTFKSNLTLVGDIEDVSSSEQYMVRIYGDCEIVYHSSEPHVG